MSTMTMADLETPQTTGGLENDIAAASAIRTMNDHAPLKGKNPTKYRHVAAVHPRQRTSWLSHDSEQSPSFLGFRNLMVIVLGR